jgi:AcrR family transcriptional regulator
MPTPARTSLTEIVAAGRRILEADGLENLTMHAVGRAVGVRGPSLYKHVRDRAALIRQISNASATELAERLDGAAATGLPKSDLHAMARTYRAFARDNPRAAALLFAPVPEQWRTDPELNRRISGQVVQCVAELGSPEHALDGARTLVAWLYGFVSMELAGAFRLGGDVDGAFEFGLEAITSAIESARRRTKL